MRRSGVADVLSGGPFGAPLVCALCGQPFEVTRGFGQMLRTVVCVNQRCRASSARARETSFYSG